MCISPTVLPGTRGMFYWQNRKQEVAKRGLLDFTQKMINNTDSNGYRGGAKFIGRFDNKLRKRQR